MVNKMRSSCGPWPGVYPWTPALRAQENAQNTGSSPATSASTLSPDVTSDKVKPARIRHNGNTGIRKRCCDRSCLRKFAARVIFGAMRGFLPGSIAPKPHRAGRGRRPPSQGQRPDPASGIDLVPYCRRWTRLSAFVFYGRRRWDTKRQTPAPPAGVWYASARGAFAPIGIRI